MRIKSNTKFANRDTRGERRGEGLVDRCIEGLDFFIWPDRPVNLQVTKLIIVTSATKGVVTTPLRFSVKFRILYRVIQRLIQHCLLRKMVYLNIIYVIATRNYEFLLPALFRN